MVWRRDFAFYEGNYFAKTYNETRDGANKVAKDANS